MSLAASLSILSAALGLYVAALSRRFHRAPGWSEQEWFSLVALTASFYSACDVVLSSPAPDQLAIRLGQLQVLLAALHLCAWMRYTSAFLDRPLQRLDRALLVLLPVLGAAAFVPGLYFSGLVEHHAFAPLGAVYNDAVFSATGGGAAAAMILVLLLLLRRFATAWRGGMRRAGVHVWALAVLLVMAANDSLAAAGVLKTPHLLDIGVLAPIVAVGYSLTGRFVEEAKTLQELRSKLEGLVTERTRQLGQSQEALLRAEKLVALGQLSAGVAHEVNNPAAVVTANLRYLSRALQESGRLPEDGLECLIESSHSMEKIAGIVRHLLDASRIAASAKTPDQPVRVAGAVAQALEAARRKCPHAREVDVSVPPDLHALAEERMLVQVLVNLIANAWGAIPAERADGRVWVRGTREGERVRIVVQDNGAGMTEDLMRRTLEPFFSTRPVGEGMGLGLAVSHGLIASLRGDLRLENADGAGTRAIVELPAAPDGNEQAAGEAPSSLV